MANVDQKSERLHRLGTRAGEAFGKHVLSKIIEFGHKSVDSMHLQVHGRENLHNLEGKHVLLVVTHNSPQEWWARNFQAVSDVVANLHIAEQETGRSVSAVTQLDPPITKRRILHSLEQVAFSLTEPLTMPFRIAASLEVGHLPFDTREKSRRNTTFGPRESLDAVREAAKSDRIVLMTVEDMHTDEKSLRNPNHLGDVSTIARSLVRLYPDLVIIPVYNYKINKWVWPEGTRRIWKWLMPKLNIPNTAGIMEIGKPFDVLPFKKDDAGLQDKVLDNLLLLQKIARARAAETVDNTVATGTPQVQM